MQRFYYLILLLSTTFLSNTTIAQDITGLWKGTIYNDSTKKYLRYEVGISDNGNGKLTGFSHTWFLIEDKEYFGVKELKIKQTKYGEIIIVDDGLIANNYSIAPSKGVRQTSILHLDASGNIMELKGSFSTNRTKEFSALTGQVFLKRKNDFMQSALVAHLQEMGLTEKLPFLATIQTINEPVVATTIIEQQPVAIIEEKAIPQNTAKTESKTDATNTASTKQAIEDKQKEKTIPPAKNIETKPAAITNADKKDVAKNTPKKVEEKATQTSTLSTISVAKAITEKTAAIETAKTTIENNTAPAPRITIARKVETIQTLTFKTDSLVLTLYDNGVVDGDTVSVIMNGRLIMNHQGLSTTAIKKTIYTKDIKEDSIQLIMYAETLGSIAPNTGLLIVYDGNDRYEIRFSGDLQKNAAILFKRRKEK
jgi:hypothetical protein